MVSKIRKEVGLVAAIAAIGACFLCVPTDASAQFRCEVINGREVCRPLAGTVVRTKTRYVSPSYATSSAAIPRSYGTVTYSPSSASGNYVTYSSQPARAVVQSATGLVGRIFGGDGLFPGAKARRLARQETRASSSVSYYTSYKPSATMYYEPSSFGDSVSSGYYGYGGGGLSEFEEAAKCLELAAFHTRKGDFEKVTNALDQAQVLLASVSDSNERTSSSAQEKTTSEPDNSNGKASQNFPLFSLPKVEAKSEADIEKVVIAKLPPLATAKIPRLVVAKIDNPKSVNRLLVASL